MPDPREDLRSIEEAIRHDAEHVEALEREKEGLDPGDPRVDLISQQVERVAAALKDKAAAERELTAEIGAGG